jgi:uncharacterized damage-inducible protein DinB
LSQRESRVNKERLRALFEYNRWCNARILDTAATLSDEQFRAPGPFPHGGLRGTLLHTLFAEWVWRMRWRGTPPGPHQRFEPEAFPTVAALRARWIEDDAHLMEFVASLTEERLGSELEYTSTEGGRHRRVLWETLVHLVNHGTQHRAEAAATLTQWGRSPGDIDLIVYLNEGRG